MKQEESNLLVKLIFGGFIVAILNLLWFRVLINSALMSGSDIGVLAAPFLVAVGVCLDAMIAVKFVNFMVNKENSENED